MESALWKIYCDSFPAAERRTARQQMALEKNPAYHIDPILSDRQPVGFLCYWQLDDVCFVEHFAMDQKHRGRGLGSDFFKRFLRERKVPVVLEVEPFGDTAEAQGICDRRIRFYESLGFERTGHRYDQPPYVKGQKPIQLELMVFRAHSDQPMVNLKVIETMLFKVVYQA